MLLVSGVPISPSGFFYHPSDPRYGASPDRIGKSFLLELKTRAEGSNAPLENLTGCHVLQANFQMACTVAEVTFLESYMPEAHVANFFPIERNNLLIDVCKMITDHIFEQQTVTYWPHEEKQAT